MAAWCPGRAGRLGDRCSNQPWLPPQRAPGAQWTGSLSDAKDTQPGPNWPGWRGLRDRSQPDDRNLAVGFGPVATIPRRGLDHFRVRGLQLGAFEHGRADVELPVPHLEPDLVGVLGQVDQPRRVGRSSTLGGDDQPHVTVFVEAAEDLRALLAGLGPDGRQQHEWEGSHLRRLGPGVLAVARDLSFDERPYVAHQTPG